MTGIQVIAHKLRFVGTDYTRLSLDVFSTDKLIHRLKINTIDIYLFWNFTRDGGRH